MSERVYNFSAGPSMLPLEVLERAGAEITNYQGSGMSVMEMSHRSKVFQQIRDEAEATCAASWAFPTTTRSSSSRAAARSSSPWFP